MAGLPADGFGVAAGVGGIRQPDSCVSVCAAGRNHGRSRQPPPHRDLHASRVDAAGLHSGGADAVPQSSGLACVRAGEFAGRGECVRHSRTAIVSGGDGRQGRSDERDRAEFFHVQRRARDRSGHRRDSGGEDRRRLVLLCQRGELHRGDHRIADDEGAQPGARGHGVAVRAHDGGIPLRRTGPRRSGRCCCCWDW